MFMSSGCGRQRANENVLSELFKNGIGAGRGRTGPLCRRRRRERREGGYELGFSVVGSWMVFGMQPFRVVAFKFGKSNDITTDVRMGVASSAGGRAGPQEVNRVWPRCRCRWASFYVGVDGEWQA